MRLVSFDYFRGIAILLIVAGHSYGPWEINSFGERVLANLITGGSALFVFISGFFFHHVFYEKFDFKEFLAKKSQNVLLPYAILTLAAIAYYVLSSRLLPYSVKLGFNNEASSGAYLQAIATYLWTGCIVMAYWYIPFIFIVFILSPIFLLYVSLSTTHRLGLLSIFLLTSIFIHRPIDNLSTLHSVLYFLPVYLIGINYSIHAEEIARYTEGKSLSIGCVVLLLAILQGLMSDGHGNYHKSDIFLYNGLDIIILQKIAMCFFLLSVLKKHADKNIPGLKLLAASSFAIYFIHPWILKILHHTGLLSFLLEFLPGIGVFFLTIPLVVASSLLIAYAVKSALKNSSRYVIGW